MIEGKRFSQIYLDKNDPVNDSTRMRNRMSAIYFELLHKDSYDIVKSIQQETGAKVPFIGDSFSLSKFFENCEIRDLLDSITIIFQVLKGKGRQLSANQWLQFISRVFSEENVGYRLDSEGGVHYYIDPEFERNRFTLIANLSSQPAVQEAFDRAYAFLDIDPKDTASSIRSIFEAVEILYKHIVQSQGKDRLNSFGVQKKLKPILQKIMEADPISSQAVDHLMDSMCDWIDAGHMYRHGQKVSEPMPPPLDFAVMYISQGATYLRYLLPLA